MSYVRAILHCKTAVERQTLGKDGGDLRRAFATVVIRTSLVERGVTSMLAINENSVNAVLLNDGWHHPITGTFRIHDIRLHADTSAGIDFGKVCAVWDEHACAAINTIVTITAPLASILALQRKK
jgi:hypothetical protein